MIPTAPWLREQQGALVAWALRGRTPHGLGLLDADGAVDPAADLPLLVTARAAIVGAAASGHHAGADDLRDLAVARLLDAFRSDDGGWTSALASDGSPRTTRRSGYDHAFVLMAGAVSRSSGAAGAALFDAAAEVALHRFWSPDEQAMRESWAPGWRDGEAYRGGNSAMHWVEACIAAWACTADPSWRDRALAIAARMIDAVARDAGWRVVEHFDERWTPLPEHNADRPADPFRPYGHLVGHAFEWARLLLQLEASGADAAWLRPAAVALWDHGWARGWAADGYPGFAYSLDWHDRVVVDRRLHWVVCEAIGAGAWLRRVGVDVEGRLADAWREASDRFVAPNGSWRHELAPDGTDSDLVWPGRPDVYHAYQAIAATLEPRISLVP